MTPNKQVIFKTLVPVKSSQRGYLISFIVFIGVFIALTAGVKYAGSLESSTVDVGTTTTQQVSPTAYNTPPEVQYEKHAIKDLDLSFSSFKVRTWCG